MDGSTAPDPARIPPHDLDAEAAVLSAVILSPECAGAVFETLQPEHFYSDANASIYAAIFHLTGFGTPFDIVTIAHELKRRGKLERVGGSVYLAQIVDATPAVANVAAHAAIVRECYRRRRLIRVLAEVQAELYAGTTGADDVWRRVKECAA